MLTAFPHPINLAPPLESILAQFPGWLPLRHEIIIGITWAFLETPQACWFHNQCLSLGAPPSIEAAYTMSAAMRIRPTAHESDPDPLDKNITHMLLAMKIRLPAVYTHSARQLRYHGIDEGDAAPALYAHKKRHIRCYDSDNGDADPAGYGTTHHH